MTVPMLGVFPTTSVSRLADHWRGDDFQLETVAGYTAQFTRAATAAVLDKNGTSRTVNRDCPAWEEVDWDNDGSRETPALLLGASDKIIWNFLAVPQAMTMYVEFVENGAKAIASAGVVYIGSAGNTGARLRIVTNGAGTFYEARYHNGTSDVVSTLAAAPATGDRVVLRAVLDAANKVQIFQSINGAAETSGALSGALTLPASWSGSSIYMGTTGDTNPGNTKFVRRKVALGVRTAAQMLAAR